jgi:hypothetical protein
LVVLAKVSTLIDAGRQVLPDLHDRLTEIQALTATKGEVRAMEEAYARVPTANFSHSILEACPDALAVSTLPTLTWCDLGTPDRVFSTLKRARLSPAWAIGGSRPVTAWR